MKQFLFALANAIYIEMDIYSLEDSIAWLN